MTRMSGHISIYEIWFVVGKGRGGSGEIAFHITTQRIP